MSVEGDLNVKNALARYMGVEGSTRLVWERACRTAAKQAMRWMAPAPPVFAGAPAPTEVYGYIALYIKWLFDILYAV
ncbi:hypothetical protein D3C81_912480 [compost metagenome]